MNSREKDLDATRAFARAVAERRAWVLNPDLAFQDRILKGLMTNYNRFGYYACPCRDPDGEKEEDRDITCPCSYSQADVIEHGHCFCALYNSPEQARAIQDGKGFTAIPERRNSGI